MRKLFILTGVTAVLLYAVMWLLYYFDFINSFWLIGTLLVELLFLLIVLIIFRKKSSDLKLIRIIAILLMCIFVFEFKLLFYDSLSYGVTLPAEPIEVVDHSGIHLMVVKAFEIDYLEDKDLILKSFEYEKQEVLNLHKIDNESRYMSKNIELLNWLLNKEDDFSRMSKNVKSYLAGNTSSSSIDEFLKRDDISGDSVGLGLAISALIADGSLKNNRTIGITGALDSTGKVLPIGMAEEKVRIAEMNSFPYIIVPSGNVEEAMEVKKSMNLKIEIFDVNHIDQAISLIQRLNKNV